MNKWQESQKFLANKDGRLKVLAEKYGVCPLKPALKKNYFRILCSAIIAQQLSAKAADCIEKRFLQYFDMELAPKKILAADVLNLRKLGISQQKCVYLKDLAHKFLIREITQIFLMQSSDEEVIDKLTQVKGIGIWTAQMFLIVALCRKDVWAFDDLGLRKTVMKLEGKTVLPNKKEMMSFAEICSPHRTLASWYLWRSLE